MTILIPLLSSALFIAFTLLPCHLVNAHSPDKMNYKAVVRNIDGDLVKNSPIGMKVCILQGSTSETVVFTETHSTSTNFKGFVSIEIGDSKPVTGTFTAINRATGPYFIKTETDVSGSMNYSISEVNQVLIIPYASNAKTVDSYNKNDLAFVAHPANGIIRTSITNWNTDNTNNVTTTSDQTVANQDAATKTYVDELEANVTAREHMLMEAGLNTTKDVDGNSYAVVKIGNQQWIVENLKVTKYNDGTSIDYVTDDTTWSFLSTGAYCWYNNDKATYKNTYGALYNWHTVNTGKLCPIGWHVPTDAEWSTLTTYLGGENVADGKLKETGTTHWPCPNTGATNESGFTALPGGDRCYCGVFDIIGYNGTWWSSTEYDTYDAWTLSMYSGYSFVSRSNNHKSYGFSVRCVY